MPFTHIVTFKWSDESYDDGPVAEALQALIPTLSGVQSYVCGPDAGVTANSYDFAVVGTFDDVDSFTSYRDHPEHQRIINELIVPHLGSRTVVQLER
ncbi:MAG: Dabb family protein [Mycobacterium sp.]